MFKQIRPVLLTVAVLALLASCQTANKDVREAARNAIETGVQPLDPSGDAASVQPDIPTGPTTTIEFSELEYDFGTVKEGVKVSHTYKFKNTGKEPLIISNAQGSCGCTVPNWTREPVKPGGTGEIVVEFNTQGKAGKRNQKVTVTANTNPPQTFLSLNGIVEGTSAEPNIQVNQ